MFGANTYDANKGCVWSATGDMVCAASSKASSSKAVQPQPQPQPQHSGNTFEHFACLSAVRECDPKGPSYTGSVNETCTNECEKGAFANERCACACKGRIIKDMQANGCWSYKKGSNKNAPMFPDAGATCFKQGWKSNTNWKAGTYDCAAIYGKMAECDTKNTVAGVRVNDTSKCSYWDAATSKFAANSTYP